MTKSEISNAFIAAGMNRWLVIDSAWDWMGGNQIHFSFDDLDRCDSRKITALVKATNAEMTDKGFVFTAK